MKLHIGGKEVKEGWKILNAQNNPGVDFIGDISDLSGFDTESVSEVYASHVLEHVRQQDALPTLQGISRILAKNGTLYVSVPDMDILAHAFINPIASSEFKFQLMRMMFGGQVDEFDYHYIGWNYSFLTSHLREAGFSEFRRVGSFGLFSDTSEYKPYGFPISLNVIAKK